MNTAPSVNTAPSFTEWLAWWSWPWRAMGEWASPSVSFAPQSLYQPILPGWLFANTINVTEENSRSPETERQIVAAHSYGQQLGRLIDIVDELVKKSAGRDLDEHVVQDFTELRNDIEKIKANVP